VSRATTLSICWAFGGLMIVGASLALARVHPFGDAGLYAAKSADAPILNNSQVPSNVRAILDEKCADCHSMQTRTPLYGRLAPASWLMERDINRGREAMNLSNWDSYSADQQQMFAAKIAHEAKSHEMPLQQYLAIHWNARVNDAEIRELADWAREAEGSSSGQADTSGGRGDPTRGAALFEKRCTGCHSLSQNRQGPRLQDVYGRTSGSVADYAYSPALKKSHVVWDQSTLDKWLTDPDAFIQGNEMDFLVSKPQERLDLIAFLKQASGK
jgi:cytochrome c